MRTSFPWHDSCEPRSCPLTPARITHMRRGFRETRRSCLDWQSFLLNAPKSTSVNKNKHHYTHSAIHPERHPCSPAALCNGSGKPRANSLVKELAPSSNHWGAKFSLTANILAVMLAVKPSTCLLYCSTCFAFSMPSNRLGS